MADDFYNLKRIYEDYGTGFNQSNYPSGVSNDTKNSYGIGTSGPGNPNSNANVGMGGAPAGGDLLNFPTGKHITPEELLGAIEHLVEHEIDQASEKSMDYAVAALKRIQRLMLHAQSTI